MGSFTHEFTSYAMVQGRTPRQQLDHDKVMYQGGCMCGFILWTAERMKEMREANPGAFVGRNLWDQDAKRAFFRKRAEEIRSHGS